MRVGLDCQLRRRAFARPSERIVSIGTAASVAHRSAYEETDPCRTARSTTGD